MSEMSDPLTNPPLPLPLPLPSPYYQQLLQNEENNDNSLIDLNGWSVVESWKNENFQMNEHQTGYLTNMYASEIISHLYLGSRMAASDKAWLSDHKITHILTIAGDIPPYFPESYAYKVIHVNDYESVNIMEHFDNTYKFIQQALEEENGNILVHCQAGISRSPSVLIAYIMRSRQIPFDEAFEFVKKQRPVTCPNQGFRNQLRLYESMRYQITKASPKYWGYLAKRWSRTILHAKIKA